MKKGTRIIAAALALCMMACMLIVQPLPKVDAAGEPFQKIVHLDCGRKYFSKDWIISLINEMAHDGYTHLQLAFGNDGLRFLLDDMSVNANGKTYTSQEVKAGIQQGNRAYHDFGVNELTQSEMDQIIAHAQKKNIQIIPLLNTPGHMDAIVTAMNHVGIQNPAYSGSVRTVDVTNAQAVAFTQALVEKYMVYFSQKGSKQFHLGADEYANDVFTGGGMGFGHLKQNRKYNKYVDYINGLIAKAKNHGMTPMAFNDGIYYEQDTSTPIDKSLVISYWSSGWSGYNVASAQFLANQGFPMNNTHGDFYYVLGKDDKFDNGFTQAQSFDRTHFSGSTVQNPVGATFCIWCDYPGAETEQVVAQKTRLPMRAMALAMNGQQGAVSGMDQSVAPGGFNADGSLNKEISSEIPSETPSTPDPLPPADVTVDVGGSQIRQQNGLNKKLTASDMQIKHPALVNVTIKAKEIPGKPGKTQMVRGAKVSSITPGNTYVIGSGSKALDRTPSAVTLPGQDQPVPDNVSWTIEKSGNKYRIYYVDSSQTPQYLMCNKRGSIVVNAKANNNRTEDWSFSNNQLSCTINSKTYYLTVLGSEWMGTKSAAAIDLYPVTEETTPAESSTFNHEITFTGKQPGRTEVTVGDVLYTVQVNGEASSEMPSEIPSEIPSETPSTPDPVPGAVNVTVMVNDTHQEVQNGLTNQLTNQNVSIVNPALVGVTVSAKENAGTTRTDYVRGGKHTPGKGKQQVVIASGDHMLKVSGTNFADQPGLVAQGANVDAPLRWTVEQISGSEYNIYQTINGQKYYLNAKQTESGGDFLSGYTYSYALQLSTSASFASWTYANGQWKQNVMTSSGFLGISPKNADFYLKYNNGWTFSEGAAATDLFAIQEKQTAVGQATYDHTITFTGKQPGTTVVKVGNVTYQVHVTSTDLASIPPLEIEHWITNSQVTPNGVNVTVKDKANVSEIRVADYPALYSEEGLFFRQFTPEFGQDKNQKPVQRWFLCYLDRNHFQTDDGEDQTKGGPGFTHIRYWNNRWEGKHYATKEWMPINTDRTQYRLVEYYMQETNVTPEVQTLVKDWGELYSDWQKGGGWFWGPYVENGSNFCFMDYAVVYEDGTQNPSTFPVNDTMFFHCENGTNRKIGDMYVKNNSEYEVYKVTKTLGTATGYQNASTFQPNYGEVEEVVWPVENQQINTAGAYIPDIPLNNRQGALIKIYIRNRKPDTNLTVHYIDDKTKAEFYSYNIQGANGALFDPNIRLIGKNTLENNVIQNTQGVNITVNAQLKDMPQIGDIYRGNNYNCERVVRSEDGMNVYLYYTFEPMRNYVVDFGLPLRMSFADLGILTNGLESVVCKKQPNNGTIRVDMAKQEVIYTPNQVMDAIVSFFVEWKGKESGGFDVYPNIQILVYPATTVYYEEGYLTDSGFAGGSKGNGMQQSDEIGSAPAFGFDPYYSGQTGMSNGTEAVSSQGGTQGKIVFKGTGIDLYMNCAPNTGLVGVFIKNLDTNSFVKFYQVDTKVGRGTTSGTAGQTGESYGLPVVSVHDLNYARYEVLLIHASRDVGVVGGDIRIDGFRVHNPLGNLAHEAYAPNELNPSFVEIRDTLLTGLKVNNDTQSDYNKAGQFMDQIYQGTGSLTGAVLVDKNNAYADQAAIKDLLDNGPKNELFLYSGQALTFNLGSATAQLGLKAVNGAVNYEINGAAYQVTSSTDLFCHKGLTGEVTVTNKSGGILSLTTLKIFQTAAPQQFRLAPVTQEQMAYAIKSVGYVNTAIKEAVVNVSLVDAAGSKLGEVQLKAEGDMRTAHTFPAEAIREAAEKAMPAGYALANAAAVQDVTVAYGEQAQIEVQIGKTATLNITFVTREKTFRWLFWMDKEHVKEVGKAQIVRVQTGDEAWCVLNADDVAAVLPAGYSLQWDMWDTYVTYGFASDIQITVEP